MLKRIFYTVLFLTMILCSLNARAMVSSISGICMMKIEAAEVQSYQPGQQVTAIYLESSKKPQGPHIGDKIAIQVEGNKAPKDLKNGDYLVSHGQRHQIISIQTMPNGDIVFTAKKS